jgi:hypothetical protein
MLEVVEWAATWRKPEADGGSGARLQELGV